MKSVVKKTLLGMALASTGAFTILAQQPQPAQQPAQPQAAKRHARGGRHMQALARNLNLTPDQRTQARSIFQEAGQSAKPVRQQIRQDRQALQAAVKAGDSNQIQKLTGSIGAEQGQIAGIRATAMSKFYKTLTPDQQQKFDSMPHGRRMKPQAAEQN